MPMAKKQDLVFGLSKKELSKRLGQNGSSSKMCLICEASDLLKSSKIFGKSGMLVNGQYFQLETLDPVISERESGLLPILPTPNASDRLPPNMTPGEDGVPHDLKKKYLRAIVLNFPKMSHQESLVQDLPPSAIGGKLNPNFIEWMMGYPMDHTKLETTTKEERKE